MTTYQASIKTPYAHLGIRIHDSRLVAIDFIQARQAIKPVDAEVADICKRLQRYLDGPVNSGGSDIPCAIKGTAFQQKVWNALKKIPPGKTVTYGQLAKQLGTSARAVGNACRKNPIPVVVPCHRVVSSSGPGGYAGATCGDLVRFKTWLLQREGVRPDRAS